MPLPPIRRLMHLLAWVRRTEFLVFLPAITLAGFWIGGEKVLLVLALGLPLLFAVTGPSGLPGKRSDDVTEESLIARVIANMDAMLPGLADSGRSTACLVLQFDALDEVLDRHGRTALTKVLVRCEDRLRGALRMGDLVAPIQGGGFMVVLAPERRLDLETLVQMAGRLQQAITTPISLGAAQIYVTVSVGLCVAGRAPELTGRSLLDAAQIAAVEAGRHGPGAIRVFSPEMSRKQAARDAMRDRIESALENGQIRPHFQPQISADTGEISGMEALARWHHPDHGCLAPAEFLHAVEGNDLTERLGEVMLLHALTALADWDKKGFRVPTISVNFAASELRNPRLPERLKCELDRFDLTPDRLTVEILETVISSSENDMVVSNISALAALGCGIDLDDFGTGHASITTIRRFAVRRLKIDRSFVTRVDQDREQQKMVSAIVSLAEQLGLQTLAEGVETATEHAMLSQLGCGHVQGFGLARPMSLDVATDWISRHAQRQERIPRIGARSR
jgi:EAL domain-containing protein (putative c-di-GMP-specific phosphodiesterase class I)/GGDEF domain-containing protein